MATIDECKNLCEMEGLKFVFKFKLMIPEIGGHMLAEESRLSVPAPRRIQIFFQVCSSAPACHILILSVGLSISYSKVTLERANGLLQTYFFRVTLLYLQEFYSIIIV